MSKNQYQGGHSQKMFWQLWQWLPILLRLNIHLQSMSKNQDQGGLSQKKFRQLAVAAHPAPPKASHTKYE
jgi:hypothetical protein